MNLQLNREFSTKVDDGEYTWASYRASREQGPTWDTLKECSVVVVLGEAGVGKTTEFENRVESLRRAQSFAFVVPLSSIIDDKNWARSPREMALLNSWESWAKP